MKVLADAHSCNWWAIFEYMLLELLGWLRNGGGGGRAGIMYVVIGGKCPLPLQTMLYVRPDNYTQVRTFYATTGSCECMYNTCIPTRL